MCVENYLGEECTMDSKKLTRMWNADQGDGTYKNPILYTDYSDPDAIRVGEDYFMIASSFCNSPAVPLLHSKDLVNWKIVNYVMDRIPFAEYDKPRHGCGAWAPSIRYHEGIYYVLVPFPDEGIVMCKTEDPFGAWSEPVYVRKVTGWIDPCPFWDEDGKAYMVSAFARSRIGFKSMLSISPVEPDLSGVLGDGQFVYDGHATQPTIEGPKLYKRNGYYYIFAPAGGVATGWQTVLRSKDIYGPYEEKIVMRQGNTDVNGPHQGAWVEDTEGNDWFLHFQDVENAGRIVHLQPMHWENDWPVIGVNAVDGCGEPVLQYRKPGASAAEAVAASEPDDPQDSDLFDREYLGLQWQWNANYRSQWYHCGRDGLTLYAQDVEENCQLCDVPNLLLQKWPAPKFVIRTRLHLEELREGDVTGMVSLGGHYTALVVKRESGRLFLEQRTGDWQNIESHALPEQVRPSIDTVEKRIRLCEYEGTMPEIVMYVTSAKTVSFAVDGQPVGTGEDMTPGRWVGVKTGLFILNEAPSAQKEREPGSVKADYYRYEKI